MRASISWPSVIGDRVELRIEAEATRSRAAGEGEGEDDAAVPGAAGSDAGTAPRPKEPDPA